MTELPDQSPTKRSAATLQSVTLIRLATAVVALFGLAVLFAWYTHWVTFLEISPGSVAIKYNTGLCFILCSAGLALLTTRFERLATVFGGLVIVIGTIVLLEYLTVLPFGIDQ